MKAQVESPEGGSFTGDIDLASSSQVFQNFNKPVEYKNYLSQ